MARHVAHLGLLVGRFGVHHRAHSIRVSVNRGVTRNAAMVRSKQEKPVMGRTSAMRRANLKDLPAERFVVRAPAPHTTQVSAQEVLPVEIIRLRQVKRAIGRISAGRRA